MGKTYGVYTSDVLDAVLSNELVMRKLKIGNPKVADKLTIAKLMGACVLYVVQKGELKLVEFSDNGVNRG